MMLLALNVAGVELSQNIVLAFLVLKLLSHRAYAEFASPRFQWAGATNAPAFVGFTVAPVAISDSRPPVQKNTPQAKPAVAWAILKNTHFIRMSLPFRRSDKSELGVEKTWSLHVDFTPSARSNLLSTGRVIRQGPDFGARGGLQSVAGRKGGCQAG